VIQIIHLHSQLPKLLRLLVESHRRNELGLLLFHSQVGILEGLLGRLLLGTLVRLYLVMKDLLGVYRLIVKDR
jgi:hypothetical protein